MLTQTKAWQIRKAICTEQVSSFVSIYPNVSAIIAEQIPEKSFGMPLGRIQPDNVSSFFKKSKDDLVLLTPWSLTLTKSDLIEYANNNGDIILDFVQDSSGDTMKFTWTATLDLSWDVFIRGFLSYLNLGSKITVKKSTNTKDYVAINGREYLATNVWCYLAAIINSNLTQVSAERFLSYIERYKV